MLSEEPFRRRLTRAIALPLGLLSLLSGVSIWQIGWLLSALRWVDHTDQVISQANYTQKLLLDMETGLRGYLLAGNQEFLEPYEQANAMIHDNLDKLKILVSDNPNQVQRVREIINQKEQWKQFISPAITRKQRGEPEPLSELESRKQNMDQLRRQIETLISVEEQLRNQRSRTARATTQTVILSSLLLMFTVGIILAYFTRRQIIRISHTYEDALQTVRRSSQRLSVLHQIDQAILASETDETLVSNALTQLQPIVIYQQAFVAVFDLEAQTAQILAGNSQTGELIPLQGTQLMIADFALEQILLREIRYSADLASQESLPSLLMQLRSHGFCSCLCVPLLVENRLIGELNLAATQTDAFNLEAQNIAREVSAQLAIALQQSRLRQQLQNELKERQLAEIELREQEQLFRSTFNQAAVGIAHVSPDGQWLRVNQKLCEIVGYTREELLQLTFQDITYPDDLDLDLTYVQQMLANEIPTYAMEKRYIRKDHSLIWINLTVALLRDNNGQPKYFISVIEYISDRKQVEEALRQLNITLEQRVTERTAQIEEKNQELEAFTYSVSHDLRAPLRTMQGFAQALLEDCGSQLEDFCRGYIDSIIDDAFQMNMLISDLLAYSRLTRTQINLRPTALDEVISEALKQLAGQIQEHQAQIRVATPLPVVIAHRPTLIQAIVNLISNGIKFVEPNIQPQIDIFATTERHNDQYWIQLSIVDNAIGIAPEHQERVFRVFERLHGAESYPGTGIGLAIVRKGLERMGGQVGIVSQLGQGSRFWLSLPKSTS
ncbi:CHASE3 domain-containing protein [Chroococcus sp. FPU101]|uniref:CHASE3 domain-containing protein n=1 Tax=Chroococcus sp. FPU101 TaxID=1974212 RepID=UPI001AA4FFF9|nr:CHASE3 domain-containing protein [Chroococcus sp. FPU101]GFE70154.1 hypothetical protein CFPU101_27640 [Chroococcus sp. FPU101]